jgi:hypothetical protein
MRGETGKTQTEILEGTPEPDTPFQKKRRLTWAMLIKCVYEEDPLICPACGGTMKIISFIEEESILRTILRHCSLWKEPKPRSPPNIKPPPTLEKPKLDYG